MLTPNQLLQQGRYRIINQLGQNGNGTDYEAFDKVLNTNSLLREIRDNSSKAANPSEVELRKLAFANEARMLTELKHESLLQVYDYFSEVDRHFVAAENTDAPNLGELLEKKKTAFDLANSTAWIEQLLDGVNYLHQQTPPIIHRDIRPQNIKLTAAGKIKLLTFGITQSAETRASAAMKNQSFDASALPYTPLEQIWEGLDAASKKVILNSYDEASEKILVQPPDARSDVYSIGATFYQLLTAKLPVDALTRSIDLLEGKIDPLPTPFELNPSIPPEVSDVIMSALEIRREHRFASVDLMRQVLRAAFVGVQEREANEAKKENDVLEIPVTEQKHAVKPLPKQETLPIEEEQKRQLELIKQQLREAEARRLEAERRAAEAEKRLLEKEAGMLKVKDIPILQPERENSAETENPVSQEETSVQVATAAEIKNETVAPLAQGGAAQDSSDEFDNLFAQPEKDSSLVKKMSAAAGLLIVLGGAFWAVWTFVISKPVQSQPAISPAAAVSTPPKVESTPSVPSVETGNAPQTETISAPTATENNLPEVSETSPASSKTKPVQAQPNTAPAKKPNIATTKTPANEKKAVTLDDLLKEN